MCGATVVGAFCGRCGARSSQAAEPGSPPAVASPPPTQPNAPVPPPRPNPVTFESTISAVGSWPESAAAVPPQTRPPQPLQPPLVESIPPSRRKSWVLAAVAIAAVLFLAAGGYAAAKLTIAKSAVASPASAQAGASVYAAPGVSPGSTNTPAAVPITSTPTPPPTPSAATSTVDPRSAAFATLEALVAQDAALPTVRGQWVAQLSSKSEGVVDTTLQQRPFTVPDILAEHLRLRGDPTYGPLVRLVHLGDWGSIGTPASPMWVTVGDMNAGSSAEVVSWCQSHFPQQGKALDNVCLARQLTLKSG